MQHRGSRRETKRCCLLQPMPSTGATGEQTGSEVNLCNLRNPTTLRFLARQVFLFDGSHDDVIWIDHFVQMYPRDF
jgi:hypothetical protein